MTDIVRIVIGTFGDNSWAERARTARETAEAQTVPCQVVQIHGRTLAEARNTGAGAPVPHDQPDWLIFLDADDELHPGYVEAMLAGDGDLRQPATQGVHPDGSEEPPNMIPRRRLIDANFMVIGTMVRAHIFHQVGGFRDIPVLEDWDVWLRCVVYGHATIGHVPDAIYRIGVNDGSRNSPRQIDLQRRYYQEIRNRYRADALTAEAAGLVHL